MHWIEVSGHTSFFRIIIIQRVMRIIDSVAKVRYPEVKIVDLVPLFSNNSLLFFYPVHLNPGGQRLVTEYFSAVLVSISYGKGAKGVGHRVNN